MDSGFEMTPASVFDDHRESNAMWQMQFTKAMLSRNGKMPFLKRLGDDFDSKAELSLWLEDMVWRRLVIVMDLCLLLFVLFLFCFQIFLSFNSRTF